MAAKKDNFGNATVQGLMQGNKLKASGQLLNPEPVAKLIPAKATSPESTSASLAESVEKNKATSKAVKSYMSIGFDNVLFKYLKFITSADGTTVTKYLNRLVEDDYKKRRGELNNII